MDKPSKPLGRPVFHRKYADNAQEGTSTCSFTVSLWGATRARIEIPVPIGEYNLKRLLEGIEFFLSPYVDEWETHKPACQRGGEVSVKAS
jgi:hypothetical protein